MRTLICTLGVIVSTDDGNTSAEITKENRETIAALADFKRRDLNVVVLSDTNVTTFRFLQSELAALGLDVSDEYATFKANRTKVNLFKTVINQCIEKGLSKESIIVLGNSDLITNESRRKDEKEKEKEICDLATAAGIGVIKLTKRSLTLDVLATAISTIGVEAGADLPVVTASAAGTTIVPKGVVDVASQAAHVVSQVYDVAASVAGPVVRTVADVAFDTASVVYQHGGPLIEGGVGVVRNVAQGAASAAVHVLERIPSGSDVIAGGTAVVSSLASRAASLVVAGNLLSGTTANSESAASAIELGALPAVVHDFERRRRSSAEKAALSSSIAPAISSSAVATIEVDPFNGEGRPSSSGMDRSFS